MNGFALLTASSALAIAAPATAQHMDHSPAQGQVVAPSAPPSADPSCPPEHAAMGHCAPTKGSAAPAGHDMSQMGGAVPAAAIGGVGTLIVVGLWMIGFPALRKRQKLENDVVTP